MSSIRKRARLMLINEGIVVVGRYDNYYDLIHDMGVTAEETDTEIRIKQKGKQVYPVYGKSWRKIDAMADWIEHHHDYRSDGLEIYKYMTEYGTIKNRG